MSYFCRPTGNSFSSYLKFVRLKHYSIEASQACSQAVENFLLLRTKVETKPVASGIPFDDVRLLVVRCLRYGVSSLQKFMGFF